MGFGLFWYSISSVESKLKRFLVSLFWFALVQSVHLSWFTATKYQGLYIIAVYVCLSIWLGAQFGVLNLFTHARRFNLLKALFISGVWTLIELSRFLVFCGFAFNPTGLALCYSNISAQALSVFGVYGMTFLVMFSSALFYLMLLLKKRQHAILWVLVCVLPYAFGFCHLKVHQVLKSKSQKKPLNVALIQTGLSPDEKIPLNGYNSRFIPLYNQWWRIFGYLKEKEASSYDFIVLPEAAVPFGMKQPLYPLSEAIDVLKKIFGREVDDLLPEKISPYAFQREGLWYVSNAFWSQVLSNAYNSEVIIGLDDTDLVDAKSYNAAFHFTPYDNNISRYEKRVLVPLAEYLPLSFLKPLVSRYGISSHATHGKEAKVFVGKKKASVSICYEECYGHMMREGRKGGADLFINITNDAWYLPSKLPIQHFIHGRLRSIENGVDVLRSCNTGVTSVVSSLGENLAIFEDLSSESQYERGALVASFVPYEYQTLYTVWGNYFIFVVCLSFIAIYFYRLREQKRLEIELSC